MKVDIDELECRARAASCDAWDRRLPNELLRADGDRAHIAANGPPVTLALIARIRELEALAEGLIEEIATNLPGSRRGELDDERALLEKGALIP